MSNNAEVLCIWCMTMKGTEETIQLPGTVIQDGREHQEDMNICLSCLEEMKAMKPGETVVKSESLN